MAIRRGSSCAVLALLALASVAAVTADVFFQDKFEGELALPDPISSAVSCYVVVVELLALVCFDL